MRNIERRLSALEASGPAELSPALKQWLGWALTDGERARLDAETACNQQSVADVATVAEGSVIPETVKTPAAAATLATLATVPQEVKEWLGVD